MNIEKNISRRSALKASLGMAASALITGNAVAQSIANSCGVTPAQPEGPFYPETLPKDDDSDLTFVNGKIGSAKGRIILVGGQVTDSDCNLISGAVVEIWQACSTGKYNHSGDPNPAKLDPNFQYWGRSITDSNGEYQFKTIYPGPYPASADWIRPSHIHYKVQKRGYRELTTQLYFAGDPYNETDLILQQLSLEEQKKVISAVNEISPIPNVEFHIQLEKI